MKKKRKLAFWRYFDSRQRDACATLHDLATPLTNVLLSVEEMKSRDGRQGRLIEQTLAELHKVTTMLSSRDFDESNKCQFAPGQVIADVLGVYRKRYGVRCYFDQHVKQKRLYGDPQALARIVIHLLNNAAESYHPNATDRQIHVCLHDNERRGFFLSVSDYGRGMSTLVKHFAVRRGFSLKPNPSGLGLAQVKSAVQTNFHGKMKIYSQPGYGTSVVVFLPY